jgi:hypothetical protein
MCTYRIMRWALDRALLQTNISKRDVLIPLKRPCDEIPRRRLLFSSSSIRRCDPTHKQRASGVNLILDGGLEVFLCQLG